MQLKITAPLLSHCSLVSHHLQCFLQYVSLRLSYMDDYKLIQMKNIFCVHARLFSSFCLFSFFASVTATCISHSKTLHCRNNSLSGTTHGEKKKHLRRWQAVQQFVFLSLSLWIVPMISVLKVRGMLTWLNQIWTLHWEKNYLSLTYLLLSSDATKELGWACDTKCNHHFKQGNNTDLNPDSSM